ncbi:MAG TPA: UDP-N-acetylmuramoyl-tripeptide--D-alanyl-D-alanine ligase [Rhodobacteraceae bacterium]|nr:UDP-N-acetylmuramoyl-tripeptide--D-alanyl-D-alanine ligase [Paracoccaceae bacterium]
MSLWTRDEAVAATGGVCALDWQANGVSIDTRSLEKGDLFVALSASRDGHDFVTQALENGAAAALVSRIPEGLENAPLLLVPDVLRGLEALGIAARARSKARVIAITGSVGKTGSKEMLRVALEGQGNIHVAEKSYNNHEGVPLTLARMPCDTGIAVIEIGMNHPGEIAPLACMARPHVALITTVAPVHLAAFSGVEEIAAEKAEIFKGLEEGGIAVLNADLETLPILTKSAPANPLLFGQSKTADFRLLSCDVGNGATVVRASTPLGEIMFKLGGEGAHLAQNAVGVLAGLHALKADLGRATLALASWHPPEGRGARQQIPLGPEGLDGHFTLINESYNANPASTRAALETLAQQAGRKVAILGDMLELGETAPALHNALATTEGIDITHTVGPLMATVPFENRGLTVDTSTELAAQIGRQIRPGDVVMVKGSLGMAMAKIIDALVKLSDAESQQISEGKL